MKVTAKTVIAFTLLAAVALLLVWGLGTARKETGEERRPSRVSFQNGETLITVDRENQQTSGMKVERLQAISRQEEKRAYGVVLAVDQLLDQQNSYVSAKADAQKAQANYEASRGQYERAAALHENRNVSDKEFQARKAAWENDQATANAARRTLLNLKSNIRQQWGPVLSKWLFESSASFARIIGRQNFLIQITLPADSVLTSAPSEAHIQTADGKQIAVELVSESPRTDPRIQGVSFFYVTSVPAPRLLPGMNVAAYLPAGDTLQGVVIPSAAVVWWNGKAWCYIQKDAEHFVRREVPTDKPLAEGWFDDKGFSSSDQVVINGAQLLLSEEFRSQIQVGERGEKEKD